MATATNTHDAKRPRDKRIALVLQGGGALGAYQAGVYQALDENGFAPDWVAGTSIGAINGAIIAGNTPSARVARLEDFWRTVSSADPLGVGRMPRAWRGAYSVWSVLQALFFGQPGFFRPRFPDPLAEAQALTPAEQASFYDTSELYATLRHLINFDVINAGAVRLTLDAVHVRSGALVHFDSFKQSIGLEHVMASGALPPGFPALRINGELYWDGGVYSNTPLEAVLDDAPRMDTLCFMVDLWSPSGLEPHSIGEAQTRLREITYASRSERHIDDYRRMHNLRRAVQALHNRLPKELRNSPEMQALASLGCHTTMNIVHLVYPRQDWESACKDVNFSWAEQKRAGPKAMPMPHARSSIQPGCSRFRGTSVSSCMSCRRHDSNNLVDCNIGIRSII